MRPRSDDVQPPDLPDLEPVTLDAETVDVLTLSGALVERESSEPVHAHRVQITESQLRAVALQAPDAPGLQLTDVILNDCDLSNCDGRGGSITRVEVRGSRMMGFGLAEGSVRDLAVKNSSLALANFGFATLKDVVFGPRRGQPERSRDAVARRRHVRGRAGGRARDPDRIRLRRAVSPVRRRRPPDVRGGSAAAATTTSAPGAPSAPRVAIGMIQTVRSF